MFPSQTYTYITSFIEFNIITLQKKKNLNKYRLSFKVHLITQYMMKQSTEHRRWIERVRLRKKKLKKKLDFRISESSNQVIKNQTQRKKVKFHTWWLMKPLKQRGRDRDKGRKKKSRSRSWPWGWEADQRSWEGKIFLRDSEVWLRELESWVRHESLIVRVRQRREIEIREAWEFE